MQILRGGSGSPHRAVMPPLTPDALFARFDELGVAHRTYSHPPVFTVEEAKSLRGTLPGGHCKSLFLKDKNGRRPVMAAYPQLQADPRSDDLVLFHEYFHGDTGRGVGASHQTGWSGLVALLLQPRVADVAGNVPVGGAAVPEEAELVTK